MWKLNRNDGERGSSDGDAHGAVGAGGGRARNTSEERPGSPSASGSSQGGSGGLLPVVALPKGGGAIRGIGEKFSMAPATGTGSLSVPIATSPGRGGGDLALHLAYDSGAGNGAFGLGWSLSTPSITRKTDKGLPHYDDGADSDIFVLSGAEDLVPVRIADGATTRLDVVDRGDHRVQRFRPRVEGPFARIERWTHHTTGDAFWRAITSDNVLSTYGRTAQARIADPAHPERVFSWLLEETRDDRGNVACYRYKAEDGAGVDPGLASESNRFIRNQDGSLGYCATAQRYVKRIQYGNRSPVARDQPAPTSDTDWLFEVVFDYGEHDAAAPTPAEAVPWLVRSDPFSSYRATFEVRTLRLCQRALMFHRFTELGSTPCLVRSTEFTYDAARVRSPDGAFDQGPVATYLTSVTQAGYLRTGPATYQRAALPTLALDYVRPIVHDELRAIDRDRAANLPGGPRATAAQWVDLDGEGIPGVLLSTERAWYYRSNRGGGELGDPVREHSLPAGAELGGAMQLVDLGGDGNLDLIGYAPPLAGYFERTADRGFAPFVALRELPNLDWNDPDLRFLDLDGDGFPDVLVTHDDAFLWYRSRAKDGFDPAATVRPPRRELDGPALVFADRTETIHLADMSGDGLVDLVRVRNGEVCYWPNLGHGRFGRKVTLDHSPRFDAADQFNALSVRFADIDGSGTSDILYLGRDGVRVYFNCTGNALTAPLRVKSLPPSDALSEVAAVDVLGTGMSCLVWTSSDPGAARSLAYVDLMAGDKPHLLASVVNNIGGETRIGYAPSTRFYLQDKAAGRPWLTRLAFPVHVVERVERVDHIARSRLVTRFAYHHGFFDGHEREFRGFACVEQWDAESFSGERGAGLFPELPYDVDPADPALDLPPVRTVTWFHTGAWLERERLERGLAREYYQGDSLAPVLPDTILPPGLSTREEREAARALRGQILRQEIYAEDNAPESVHPYTVSERSHEIRVLQRAEGAHHAVFCPHPSETVNLHYERRPDDPRMQHELVLEVDDFGRVTRSAAIGYPRRAPDEPEQARLWATMSDASVANRAAELDWYRIGVPVSSAVSELTGLVAPASGLIAASAVRDAIAAATEIPYEASASGAGLQRRTVKRQRALYYRDDLTAALPLGTIESRAIPYETYQQAFTPGLVTSAFGTRVDDTMLTSRGRYVLQDGLWWAPSGRVIPDPSQFYLPVEAIDPFGQHHHLRHDGYALLPLEAEDPLGNRITAGARDAGGTITQNGNDYRVLAPTLMTDPNDNRTAVEADALGMVVRLAAMGKAGANEGDTLGDPTMRFEYDVHRWEQTGAKPVFVHIFAREQHGAGNPRWQESYLYSDGSGREVMQKIQAEPGETLPSRWVGTGRTVFDNKGNPVKKYEPFFSPTFDYEDEADIVETGVTSIRRYDPLGRLVRTDAPDGTNARVVFDAWTHEDWDPNDTVEGTPWLARKQAGTAAEQRCATLALDHAGTPTVAKLDALGRVFLTVADNGDAGTYQTRVALDIDGNPRSVTDARGVATVLRVPDMLGRVLRSTSPDAGDSRELPDVAGKPIVDWTARNYTLRREYDALQRPSHLFAQLAPGSEKLVECFVYGEVHPDAKTRNLRGTLHQVYDGAGVHAIARFDFHGNPLEIARRLSLNYHGVPDWTALAGLTTLADIEAAAGALLEAEAFTTTTAYDALNRVTLRTTPDGSETRPAYNEANLLERLEVRIRGAATFTAFIEGIDYNARGQRVHIGHGNGTACDYTYDPETFRLIRQRTIRATSGFVLQDLQYEYDPVGNIVQVTDAVSYGNPAISANGLYEYDPIYQLVTAEGREHPGQQPTAADTVLLDLTHPNDLQALRRYHESYGYDAVGNLLQVSHQAIGTTDGWTRNYDYATDSNRLLGTSAASGLPGATDPYTYDAHGNMISMPHLVELRWDHLERFQLADLGGGGQVHFACNATGQRVRKAYEHGGFVEERIYLGIYELYRKRNLASGQIAVERQTLHVQDAAGRAALIETKTIDTSIPGFTAATRLRYQLVNHLGSTMTELDGSGAVITYEEYFAYGGTSWRASDSSVDVSARRYRYAGMERDDETGLYHMGARYYAPWLGRWTSTDPAGFVDGPNLYRYARNNPVLLIDPQGTDPQKNMPMRTITIDELSAVNPIAADGAAKMKGAKSGNESPPVTILDYDTHQTVVKTLRDVQNAPNYVDNGITSAGAPDAHILTLQIKTLRYMYNDFRTLDLPLGAIDFSTNTTQTQTYEQYGGVIYPVRRDGTIAFDPQNTPNIVRGALLNIRTARDISEYRVTVASLAYAFAVPLAANAGMLSMSAHMTGTPRIITPRVPLSDLTPNTSAPSAPKPPLASVVEGHPAGQGFSGVYDTANGRMLLRPSTESRPLPEGWVARRGGHATVSSELGGNRSDHLGFAAILDEHGGLRLTWRSGQLNRGPNSEVPAAMRPAIVNAVQQSTGLKVNSF